MAADAVEGMDAVCHQAARVGLGVDFADAPGYVADNQLATARLLAALAATGFAGRLVLASSMVVYGEGRYRCPTDGVVRAGPRRAADLDAGRFDPPCPVCGAPLSWAAVDESAPLDPRSVYAASKVGQEHLCASWARDRGAGPGRASSPCATTTSTGRAFPFGTPYAGVAALWCTALRRGEAPRVFEDGRQTRDFVHVTDVAAANLRRARRGAGRRVVRGGQRVLGRTGHRSSTWPPVCADAFGPAAPRPVVTGEYRLGDVRHVVASPDRAAALIGFGPGCPSAEGLAGMAEWSGSNTSSPRQPVREP